MYTRKAGRIAVTLTAMLTIIISLAAAGLSNAQPRPGGKLRFKAVKTIRVTYKPPYLKVEKTLSGPEIEKIFGVKQLKQEYRIEITRKRQKR